MATVLNSTTSFVVGYIILVLIQLLFFASPDTWKQADLFDLVLIALVNLTSIYFIAQSQDYSIIGSTYDPPKPRAPYVGYGQDMKNMVWSTYYDYSKIVEGSNTLNTT